MTVTEAITLCNEKKPNQYSDADKLLWLSSLDEKITEELLKTHRDAPDTVFSGYAEKDETVLLVPDAYAELYPLYLFAQIDFLNAEFTRYQNSAALFNAAYEAFSNYYNRVHAPLQNHSLSV